MAKGLAGRHPLRATDMPDTLQPILVLRAGSDPVHALVAEVLRCEGYPWLAELPAADFEEVPAGVCLLVLAGGDVDARTASRLASAGARGLTLIATAPALAAELGVTLLSPLSDAHLSMRAMLGWQHGALPLLCPGEARPLQGAREVAGFEGAQGESAGSGLVEVPVGAGRAWLYGSDLARVMAALRHGTGALDERPQRDMGPLAGPRHLYGFYTLSNQLPRDVPVADIHQDLLRTLVQTALDPAGWPRLWHFPAGAPALWFIKADGCGEPGLETLVEAAEQHGGLVTFCAPPASRYSGAQVRAWQARGHAFSIEANINDLTQETVEVRGQAVRRGRSVDEFNRHGLPRLRDRLLRHRDDFEASTGLTSDTVCIHSCQWIGQPMAALLLELGWHTPTHFISHDPRMRYGERYGPYMIASALPLRYFDPIHGLLDLWHMPAQWDESQTLGQFEPLVREKPTDWPGWQQVPATHAEFYHALAPDRAMGVVGLSQEAYGAELARFAHAAAARWHGVQICNFHPLYVAGPQDHPRASRRALELGLTGALAAGAVAANLEDWSRFFRARAALRLTEHTQLAGATLMTLEAPRATVGLTLLLPSSIVAARNAESGENYPLREWWLEERTQRGLVIDLEPDRPVSLWLQHAAPGPDH